MEATNTFGSLLAAHWPTWTVTLTLIVAAVIDGYQLKVPNWLTFPMIISGWAYCTLAFGLSGFGWSLAGTGVGLALLLPAYAIGGMGAGDVKLLAGVGAWMYAMQEAAHTYANPAVAMLYAFVVSAAVGGVIALVMAYRRDFKKHASQFHMIVTEIMTIRDPNQLAEIAAQRKSSMLLLPYGIPIASAAAPETAVDHKILR